MRLGTRLLWPLISVVGLVMLAYGAYAVARRERQLLDDANRETQAYATALGIAVEYAIGDGDSRDLEQILARISEEPKIYGVIVYDSAGRAVRAASPLTLSDTVPADRVRELLREADPAVADRMLHDERFLSVFRPIRGRSGRVLGGLEILQPLTPIFAEVARTRGRVVIATLALILGLAGMLLWLVRGVIARPLQQLVQGARALGSGELDYRIEQERGATELAELSVEFNRMAAHVQAAQDSLVREAEERLVLERQLRNAEKLAEVGNLAAGLAHEIAAPLNVVAGRAEMLRTTDKPAHLRDRDLRIIVDQIGRITVIVRNLLSFARRREPHLQPVSVDSLVHTALELLDGELERANTQVVRESSRDLVVEGDPQLLHQVLVNLLLNAIQSVEQVEGDRRITVRTYLTSSGADAKTMIALEVADTGVGLPEEIRAHLFEPFFTTKPPGRGTGLGLAVVRGIVEAHAGMIEVGTASSSDHSGAVFRVLLPAAAGYHG